MNSRRTLPETARDVLRLRFTESLLYNGLVNFFKLTGLWNHPIRANGDLAAMSFLDKVYWVYKTRNPILKARRGSALENFFKEQQNHQWRLPADFRTRHGLRLSAVGDLMNHDYLLNSKKTLYTDVADSIFGTDIAMANLECMILPEASGALEFSSKSGPPLYFDIETFDILKSNGKMTYAFMAAASNHSLDFGAAGIDSTIRILKQQGIAFHGINKQDQDAAIPVILERNGIHLAVLSFTFGLNAHRPPPHRPLIVNRLNLNDTPQEIDFNLLDKQLAYCKTAGVDFVLAQLHWGLEYEFYPTPEQIQVAHHLAERGVDAVIGHHPHVIQPVEYYHTQRDANRVVPIFYSLGSLINPFSASFLCRSYIAQIELAKGAAANGSIQTYVRSAQALDVLQTVDLAHKTLALRLRHPTP